jgi:hypothetical protein
VKDGPVASEQDDRPCRSADCSAGGGEGSGRAYAEDIEGKPAGYRARNVRSDVQRQALAVWWNRLLARRPAAKPNTIQTMKTISFLLLAFQCYWPENTTPFWICRG